MTDDRIRVEIPGGGPSLFYSLPAGAWFPPNFQGIPGFAIAGYDPGETVPIAVDLPPLPEQSGLLPPRSRLAGFRIAYNDVTNITLRSSGEGAKLIFQENGHNERITHISMECMDQIVTGWMKHRVDEHEYQVRARAESHRILQG